MQQPATGHPAVGYPQSMMPQAQAQAQPEGPWSFGLCQCCSEPGTCCVAFWCPCITFGRIAEIVDQGSTSCGASGALYTLIMCVTGCACCYSCCYRTKMRKLYNLKGGSCGDCVQHFFCESCALTQEYRELQNRGFDMDLGWHGNMQQHNRSTTGGIAMATAPPALHTGMTK